MIYSFHMITQLLWFDREFLLNKVLSLPTDRMVFDSFKEFGYTCCSELISFTLISKRTLIFVFEFDASLFEFHLLTPALPALFQLPPAIKRLKVEQSIRIYTQNLEINVMIMYNIFEFF
jgi:hypothetical protein